MTFPAAYETPADRVGPMSWIVPLGLAGAVAMATVAARTTVVRIAPRSAVLFEAAGLPVNVSDVTFRNVSAQFAPDGDRRVLLVQGEVENIGRRDAHAPPMRVAVQDASGQAVYSWTTRPPQRRIGAGERVAFLARLASPPPAAARVVVEFEPSKVTEISAGAATKAR